jgi:hypothetical protein
MVARNRKELSHHCAKWNHCDFNLDLRLQPPATKTEEQLPEPAENALGSFQKIVVDLVCIAVMLLILFVMMTLWMSLAVAVVCPERLPR